jgi:hypothetical protein
MKINDALRLMAGSFTLISLALAHFHSPYWLWFTAFIGLNQLQSAFSKNCPAMFFMRKFGLKE